MPALGGGAGESSTHLALRCWICPRDVLTSVLMSVLVISPDRCSVCCRWRCWIYIKINKCVFSSPKITAALRAPVLQVWEGTPPIPRLCLQGWAEISALGVMLWLPSSPTSPPWRCLMGAAPSPPSLVCLASPLLSSALRSAVPSISHWVAVESFMARYQAAVSSCTLSVFLIFSGHL